MSRNFSFSQKRSLLSIVDDESDDDSDDDVNDNVEMRNIGDFMLLFACTTTYLIYTPRSRLWHGITFANFQNKRKHFNATSTGCSKTIISTLKTIERGCTDIFGRSATWGARAMLLRFWHNKKMFYRWPARVLLVEWDKATVPPQLSLFTALIAYLERKLWCF